METNHNRWAITPPNRESRRFGWVLALADGQSPPQLDEQASWSFGTARASRLKALVAHVLARS